MAVDVAAVVAAVAATATVAVAAAVVVVPIPSVPVAALLDIVVEIVSAVDHTCLDSFLYILACEQRLNMST